MAQEAAPSALFPTRKGTAFTGSNFLLAQIGNSDFFDNNSLHYNVGISPRVGYFIKDNFALGLDLGVNLDGYTKTQHRLVNTEIGLFGRYYFGKAADKNGAQNKLRAFVELGAGYGHTFNRYLNVVNDTETVGHFDYNSFNFHVMPGVNYFLNKNVALEGGLNFSRQHFAIDEPHLRDNFDNLSLSVGLQFFFGRKK